MQLTSRIVRQISLLSLLLVIVPMVVFPERFGSQLGNASLVAVLWEMVFYGAAIYVLHRHSSLLKLVMGAGVCLLYRLAIGAILGLAISGMYSMNFSISLSLGLYSYIPGIMIQVLATPFVLRPFIGQLWPKPKIAKPEPESVEPAPRETAAPPAMTSEDGRTSIVISKKAAAKPVATKPVIEPEPQPLAKSEVLPDASKDVANGFDQATRYIGEDGSVQMAAVIDRDGLVLGQFYRGDNDPEDLAPFADLFRNATTPILDRMKLDDPEKINLELKDQKLMMAFTGQFALIVLAERQMDDFLKIRVNQSLEIIKKYMANRYSEKLFENVEIYDVRGA